MPGEHERTDYDDDYYDDDRYDDDDDDDDDDNNNDDNGDREEERKAREKEKVPLSELIETVGDELREAAEKDLKDPDKPIMRFKECQIEVAVEVAEKEQGGIAIWVFTLGAERTRTEANTITVTFERIPSSREAAQEAAQVIKQ